MHNSESDLHRGLAERHISLMALGAAIGVGLFLGSATAIKIAGPAILISYLVCGGVMFIIMRALGEMAIHNPVSGSFARYAQDYIGPFAGFLTGWTYWFGWVIGCMAETSAVSVYMHLWYPDTPSWVWTFAALLLCAGMNFISVKIYGEFEFWVALIKVATIVLMIVVGAGTVFFGFANGGIATGFHNLWTHGGFMPHGLSGILLALPMVAYSYAGLEVLGLTAGEAKNPTKSLSRAINSVFWRVLIFYFGSLLVIMAIYPWNEIGTQGSPFVMMFQRMGIPGAAGIVNFVVLTAALSAANSGIYCTGRMLFNLAQNGHASPRFSTTSNGVPRRAIMLTGALLIIGVALNYVAPSQVFVWLSAIAAFSSIWTWGVILVAQFNFRRSLSSNEVRKMKLRVPIFPYANYVAGLFLVGVLVSMAFREETRVILGVGPAWILLLCVVYYMRGIGQKAADVRNRSLANRT
ncbi:amino acid permease [Burkholderia contaminans]|uniref:amino acid permease n=1 Tax=Burkholderia contaminans TaxID=488447 RepID=UPI0008F4E0AC|nr:amino acid permease [Burkholderia contaminans]